MMGEIFTEAIGVISWLGPARDDDSNLVMYLMRFDITPEPDSRELEALLSLCHRRYWRRVWIIQELYLAKSYVIWCGHESISDTKFETSLANLNCPNDTFSDNFSQSPANPTLDGPIVPLHRDQQLASVNIFLDISTDYKRVKESFKVDYSKTPRDVFLELLCQRDLSTWRRGEENRWLELAERMKLEIDEDLRRSISEKVNI
ncbi:heterokaryon incompatibility protein het-6 [Fusarium bulbicola]|nr:heterokaryon incompatibility protein het-6 [Fusarium bulbicola]